ncbi:hypothetical protein HK101_010201 [Irineochytrium annulatum]|nr:hypothetical protein HK101_010201 [Irineochytrium annulatum]
MTAPDASSASNTVPSQQSPPKALRTECSMLRHLHAMSSSTSSSAGGHPSSVTAGGPDASKKQSLLRHLHSFGSVSTLDFEVAAAANAPVDANAPQTPLPYRIVTVLLFVIWAEPMSMTLIFPFIYFMVRDFLVDGSGTANEKDIGYYVGFIASAFSLAQFLTSIFWGWCSDKFGRRPILLLGLIGNTITILAFGVSHSLTWAILSRGACGFLNGNVGVAKCVMGEITDSTNQAKGFSMFGNPVDTFPALFGGNEFLRVNPYFLPCLCSAVISLIGFVVGYFCLEETLPSKSKVGYFPVPADEERAGLLARGHEEEEDEAEVAASSFFNNGDNLARGLEGLRDDSDDDERARESILTQVFQTRGARSADPDLISVNDESAGCGSLTLRGDSPERATRCSRDSVSTQVLRTKRAEDVGLLIQVENDDGCGSHVEKNVGGMEKKAGERPLLGVGRPAVVAIVGYGLLSFQNIIFDETLSLWVVSPIKEGGLNFTASDIGGCLSLMGICTLFYQLMLYPYLARFATALQLYRFATFWYIIIFPVFPMISTYLADTPYTVPVLLVNLAMRHMCNVLSFTSVMIMDQL